MVKMPDEVGLHGARPPGMSASPCVTNGVLTTDPRSERHIAPGGSSTVTRNGAEPACGPVDLLTPEVIERVHRLLGGRMPKLPRFVRVPTALSDHRSRPVH